MKSFALALGAGGARALAHVAVFEALDELNIRPAAIAGSSFGALIGAAYASSSTITSCCWSPSPSIVRCITSPGFR